MTTAYTSLLGLALPVTGELSGTWGDTVNTAITTLLDSAIAGTTTLSTDADVTLTTTTGAANTSRQAILLCSGARTVLRTITAPAQSKIYTVINATTGGFSVKIVGVGPTTGVTIVAGESAVVAWNGSDFIKVSNTGGSASFTNVTVTGTTTLSGLTASTALALNASKEVVSVTNTGTGNNVLATSPTLVTPALGTPSSGVVTNLTGTASININGTVGATTATTGAFTTLSATGVTTVQAGTAALPAITTTGDTNTGIFFPAADTIAFSEGGVESMRIDSSGNVGIGTSSPTTKLNIVGSSNSMYMEVGGAVRPLRFTSFATSVADAGHKIDASSSVGAIALAVAGVEYARLDSAGNVGFATSVPLSRIDARAASAVIGNYQTIQAFSSDSAAVDLGGGIGLGGYYSTTTSLAVFGNIVGRKSNGTAGNFDGYLAFGTNNTSTGVVERMRIDATGNVGIGASSPLSKLDVALEATLTRRFLVNYDDSLITIKGSNNASNPEALRVIGDNIRFNTGTSGSGTERMRLLATGPLVHGVTATQLSTSIYASGNSATDGVIGARNGSGPSTFQVVMDSNANCGYLGTSNPSGSALLRINSEYGTQFTTGGTERARFNTTGALVFAGGTTTADGIGITFPATQSASSNANTLDDYEEGTFEVVIVGSGGGTATGSSGPGSGGTYIKIGKMVYCQFYFANPGISGTLSGDLRLNLPFTVANATRFDNGSAGYFATTRDISSGATSTLITLQPAVGAAYASFRQLFLGSRNESSNLTQATGGIVTTTLLWGTISFLTS